MGLLRKVQSVLNSVTIAKMASDRTYWDSIPRMIAPSTLQILPKYVKINDKVFARSIIIGVPPISDVGGYPSDLSPTLVDELLNVSSDGVKLSISFTVVPINNANAMKLLDTAIFKNRVTHQANTDKNNPYNRFDLKKELEHDDFVQNYKAIFKNTQKMFHTAHIITIYGQSEDDISRAESHVCTILEANRVYWEIPDYQQQEVFLSALPIPSWLEYTFCELFSYHTASLLCTRNPNSRTDDCGLLIGRDMKTQKDIMVDLNAMGANHAIIAGATRSGKTYMTLLLLARSLSMLDRRVVYITPKADSMTDYRNTCAAFGAQASVIDIGPGAHTINPLEIIQDGSSRTNSIQEFDAHMELIDNFFSVLFEGSKSSNQMHYLNETLIEVYRRKGIVRENPATWIGRTDWPTLLDLREIWLSDAAQDRRNVTAQAMVDKSFMFNTSWSFLNWPTDINFKADFIVLDLSSVPDSLKTALNVFMTGLLSLRFRTDNAKKTIIAVDEARVFLHEDKLSKFLLRILTQGGSFGISLWLITQQPSDLEKVNMAEEFKTNTQLAMIMGNMKRESVGIVQKFFNLDESTVNDLLACGTGEGIFKCGDSVTPIQFIGTDYEANMIAGKSQKPIADIGCENGFGWDTSLNTLISEHGFISKDWISRNTETITGYTSFRVSNAIGQGTIRSWIRNDLMQNGMVWNQSVDHYATVLQIAGYLILHGIRVEINHNDSVDITVYFSHETIHFEYERPGSHNTAQLLEKNHKTNSGKLVFIGTTENIRMLEDAVGEQNTVRRGSQLRNLLDDLIEQSTEKSKPLETI